MTDRSPEERPISLGKIRVPDDVSAEYANYLNVNHGPHDFRITFGRLLLPPGGLSEDSRSIEPTAVADVIVAASNLPSMIEALSTNYERWANTYGDSDPDNPDEETEQ